jgi:CRP-like cAMP-binding protein
MNPRYLLAQTSLFGHLSASHRRALAEVCRPVEFRRRAVLFEEGRRGDAFFLLARGRVQLHKTAPDGREIVIKVVQPGETFAEVILFEEARYPVTAVALTDGLLLKILRRDLQRLLAEETFRNDFIAMLMRKQRYLAERIRQLSTQSVEQRFFHFLREQYGAAERIELGISRKALAAAIGVTPETLSRLLRRLQAAGDLIGRGRMLNFRTGFWRAVSRGKVKDGAGFYAGRDHDEPGFTPVR